MSNEDVRGKITTLYEMKPNERREKLSDVRKIATNDSSILKEFYKISMEMFSNKHATIEEVYGAACFFDVLLEEFQKANHSLEKIMIVALKVLLEKDFEKETETRPDINVLLTPKKRFKGIIRSLVTHLVEVGGMDMFVSMEPSVCRTIDNNLSAKNKISVHSSAHAYPDVEFLLKLIEKMMLMLDYDLIIHMANKKQPSGLYKSLMNACLCENRYVKDTGLVCLRNLLLITTPEMRSDKTNSTVSAASKKSVLSGFTGRTSHRSHLGRISTMISAPHKRLSMKEVTFFRAIHPILKDLNTFIDISESSMNNEWINIRLSSLRALKTLIQFLDDRTDRPDNLALSVNYEKKFKDSVHKIAVPKVLELITKKVKFPLYQNTFFITDMVRYAAREIWELLIELDHLKDIYEWDSPDLEHLVKILITELPKASEAVLESVAIGVENVMNKCKFNIDSEMLNLIIQNCLNVLKSYDNYTPGCIIALITTIGDVYTKQENTDKSSNIAPISKKQNLHIMQNLMKMLSHSNSDVRDGAANTITLIICTYDTIDTFTILNHHMTMIYTIKPEQEAKLINEIDGTIRIQREIPCYLPKLNKHTTALDTILAHSISLIERIYLHAFYPKKKFGDIFDEIFALQEKLNRGRSNIEVLEIAKGNDVGEMNEKLEQNYQKAVTISGNFKITEISVLFESFCLMLAQWLSECYKKNFPKYYKRIIPIVFILINYDDPKVSLSAKRTAKRLNIEFGQSNVESELKKLPHSEKLISINNELQTTLLVALPVVNDQESTLDI
ncbi:hypothetical protein SNEBB_007997 [Seison nebaliae]|nr:hypothetical protein SNEBB_007997 [Seison nebaliae]